MKLQKQISRRIGDKEYAKYTVVIPGELVKELQWKDGEDLEPKVQDGELLIKKSKSK